MSSTELPKVRLRQLWDPILSGNIPRMVPTYSRPPSTGDNINDAIVISSETEDDGSSTPDQSDDEETKQLKLVLAQCWSQLKEQDESWRRRGRS
jgi:hypothetical protein